MVQAIKINALPRADRGSSENRRLRRGGFFPGIVYGAGKQVELVKVNEHEFRKGLSGHASEHILLDLAIEGKDTRKVILQEVQHNSLTGSILHADFHEISMTEKLRIKVRIELTGLPVGVSQGGGVLEHLLRDVEIECLPADLMESIKVDVSALNVGESLTVSGIQLDPAKYKLIANKDLAVAAVAVPKEEEVKPAAEGEAAAEPEVIKEKKPEEGAEAAAPAKGGAAPAKGGAAAPAKGAAAPAKGAAKG